MLAGLTAYQFGSAARIAVLAVLWRFGERAKKALPVPGADALGA